MERHYQVPVPWGGLAAEMDLLMSTSRRLLSLLPLELEHIMNISIMGGGDVRHGGKFGTGCARSLRAGSVGQSRRQTAGDAQPGHVAVRGARFRRRDADEGISSSAIGDDLRSSRRPHPDPLPRGEGMTKRAAWTSNLLHSACISSSPVLGVPSAEPAKPRVDRLF